MRDWPMSVKDEGLWYNHKMDQAMRMKIDEERVINGDIDTVWRIATDVNRWSTWDPHEEAAEIHGPFEVGTNGTSKPRGGPAARWVLTKVENKKAWALRNKMLIGTIEKEIRYEPLPGGKIRCEDTMIVRGPLVMLFWLRFERMTRADMQATWAQLEKEVAKQAQQ
jgi:Polyketide cyclase / dehydrase and lipid transport